MELLIVIVVIAILAAITIIAYNGITQKAHASALTATLSQNATLLSAYNATNGTYPADQPSAGLKANSDISLAYTPGSGNTTYCLQASGWGLNYKITDDNTVPASGTCGAGVTYIQTLTTASCPATMTSVVDARDNHTYWVQKLADGKCWMLTNLAYAGGGTNTYGDMKTLTDGTNSATTYTTASYYVVPSTTNYTTTPTTPSSTTSGTSQYGYLYNWCGAMGGQATAACANATTPAPDTTTSVCPAGWRLPTGNGGEFSALNTAVNGGSTSTDAGLLTTWLAQLSGSASGSNVFGNQGNYGYYWSSTPTAATASYEFYFYNTGLGSLGQTKYLGLAVRCVASS